MDAVRDKELEIAHHGTGMSEVDDHLGARRGQRGEGIALVEGCDELEPVSGTHSADDLRTHATCGSQDSDTDGHRVSPRGVLADSG